MKLGFRRGAAAAAILVFFASAALAQTRGITPEDYFAFETLSDPRFSPDGSTIAFVVTTVDQKQNRRHSDIWKVAADGSAPPAALTAATQSSNHPRWSPDSKTIAFLSSRPWHAAATPSTSTDEQPRTQVWLLPLWGGEARRLTNLQNGVSSFAWSPDGSRLVCVGRSGPSDTAKSPSDVRHYKHLNYKFNDSAPVGRRRRVRRGPSDHERRRLERRRSAVVAGRQADRVRVGSERQGIRREPQHRRVGD